MLTVLRWKPYHEFRILNDLFHRSPLFASLPWSVRSAASCRSPVAFSTSLLTCCSLALIKNWYARPSLIWDLVHTEILMSVSEGGKVDKIKTSQQAVKTTGRRNKTIIFYNWPLNRTFLVSIPYVSFQEAIWFQEQFIINLFCLLRRSVDVEQFFDVDRKTTIRCRVGIS